MKKNIAVTIVIIVAVAIIAAFFAGNGLDTKIFGKNLKENLSSANVPTKTFQLLQTIPLPNVQGRIDHMDIDLKGQKLFVAELGNDSVGIIDLKTGNLTDTITDLNEPQGVLFIPDSNEIFVSNGGDGTVEIFDADSLDLIKTISLSGNADNMRYDQYQKTVYVGYGAGALGIIDPMNNTLVTSINLDGHPESFQISSELSPGIFVNVPSDDSISVIDAKKKTVVSKWQNNGAHDNYPMALDEEFHRLFVVYRNPSQISIIDTDTGKTTANVNIPGDVDDIFFEDSTYQIYVSSGDGFLYIISENGDGSFSLVGKVSTGYGARTSLFVYQTNELYVAVPNQSSQQAQILVYKVQKIL